jgi:hypothetical protein
MDFEKSANLVEAALWFTVSLVFVRKAIRAHARLRWVFLILAAAFVVFGTSDIIESGTGAWWRPWWLLALKATCMCAILFGFMAILQDEEAVSKPSSTDAMIRVWLAPPVGWQVYC